YFLDYLVISNLNSTVKPQVSILTDTTTNRVENIYTNVISRYNYAGVYEQAVCGMLNQAQMTALDTTLVDAHLTNALAGVPGTNGPMLSSVEPTETHPLGGTWRDYLWMSWSNGISAAPYLGMQIRSGQGANSERYDLAGNWNPGNVGAWKSTTYDALREQHEV